MYYLSMLRYREKKESLSWLTYHFWVFTFWMKKSLLAFDILFTVFGYNIKHFLVFDVLSSTGDWKSDETLVFSVNFMAFLYHIKHSGSFLIYYLPLWVLAIHECLSSVTQFINSLGVISNGSF